MMFALVYADEIVEEVQEREQRTGRNGKYFVIG